MKIQTYEENDISTNLRDLKKIINLKIILIFIKNLKQTLVGTEEFLI